MGDVREAIRQHCRHCMQNAKFECARCDSKMCILNKHDVSDFRRIKNYCKTCAADNKPNECAGTIIHSGSRFKSTKGICPLHPFRMGTNPHRKTASKFTMR